MIKTKRSVGRPMTGTEKKEVSTIRMQPTLKDKIIEKHGSLQVWVDKMLAKAVK